MNVVDSSGWLEFIMDGPNAGAFERAIADADSVLVPTLVITEVVKIMTRRMGEEPALLAAARLSSYRTVDLDLEVAIEAAGLGVTEGLALADSIILATARLNDATLWTQDADFEDMEGVRYVPRQ